MDKILDYTIEFINPDFDVKSELSDEYNAGNKIYGRDVALYLENQLGGHVQEVQIVDEDWGWQVYGNIDSNHKFDINIYAWGLLNDAPGEELYLWRLLLEAKKKHKVFGILPIFKAAKCEDGFRDLLADIFGKNGCKLKRMETGVEW
jgi:hypothetical protein